MNIPNSDIQSESFLFVKSPLNQPTSMSGTETLTRGEKMDLELVRHLIKDVIDEWYCYGDIGLVEISMLEMVLLELEQ